MLLGFMLLFVHQLWFTVLCFIATVCHDVSITFCYTARRSVGSTDKNHMLVTFIAYVRKIKGEVVLYYCAMLIAKYAGGAYLNCLLQVQLGKWFLAV